MWDLEKAEDEVFNMELHNCPKMCMDDPCIEG